MSDESTNDLAELAQLNKDLTACLKPKSVQLVNSESAHWPVGYIQADPNKTVQDLPHGDIIREKLRARAKDEKADPQDRAAAIEALRVIYRETN
jgi:hypothetical protein